MLFGCSTANFGKLLRGQPHSPYVDPFVFTNQPKSHREPFNEVGSSSPAEHLVECELEAFLFIRITH